MRQPQHKNRMRARNRRQPNPINRIYESNGPDVKIRGTAQHVAEKYMQLGRDALSSGDEIKAESYFQHAEHYYRIIAAAQEQIQQRRQQQQEQREQRMRGNGRSRTSPQPVAEVPAPEAAPALPAPDTGGDAASQEPMPADGTALQPAAADASAEASVEAVTVIDVSSEAVDAAANDQDRDGDGAAPPEPVVQVMDLTGTEAVDETEAVALDSNGKDSDETALEAAEDWGGTPPGFLMQPVPLSKPHEVSDPKANGGNGKLPAETASAEAESAAEEKTAESEEKPKRTRRTRTTRTTRRTRRTTRKNASTSDAASGEGTPAGDA